MQHCGSEDSPETEDRSQPLGPGPGLGDGDVAVRLVPGRLNDFFISHQETEFGWNIDAL